MKRLNKCPFALTSGGRVILNATELDGSHSLQEVLDVAREHGRVIFIGIELTPGEASAARERIRGACDEAAAHAAGRRQRLRREGKGPA
jgi:hypothetical protein